MTLKQLEQCEQEWRAAEKALEAAQKMPGGPERVAALRRAGQLRNDAYKSKCEIQDSIYKKTKRLRRPFSN
jgi:hypothetical protein